jgi:recombinational DNA repair protein RecT
VFLGFIMTNEIVETKQFKALVLASATKLLEDWGGTEAKNRIALAFLNAALAAKNPQDFYECSVESIGTCIAIAAMTNLSPGSGPASPAYLIPRRSRKGEKPQLTFNLSHRGIITLARRAGTVVVPLPVGYKDLLEFAEGEISSFLPSPDEPPTTWEELRGVVLVIKDLQGTTLMRGWVPKKLIEIRRGFSDSWKYGEKNKGQSWGGSSIWHQWPVELAMKTALHYAVGRGWISFDMDGAGIAAKAMLLDQEADFTPRPPPDAQPDVWPKKTKAGWMDKKGDIFDPVLHKWSGGEPDVEDGSFCLKNPPIPGQVVSDTVS